MAKLDLNKLFDEIRGKIGNLVFRRRADGTLIVSSKPDYKGELRYKGPPAAHPGDRTVSKLPGQSPIHLCRAGGGR